MRGSGTAQMHAIDLFVCRADKSFTVLLILNGRLQTFSEPNQLLTSRNSSDSESLTGVDGLCNSCDCIRFVRQQ